MVQLNIGPTPFESRAFEQIRNIFDLQSVNVTSGNMKEISANSKY